MPLISVVLSTHNDEAYIKEAVDSILNQTITDLELIVINDGSTDKTGEILDKIDDPRIVRINHETSKTLPVSLNKGLAIAQGEFIARMDGDDISHPTRFEVQLDFFKTHPDVDVLGTQIELLDVKTGIILQKTYPTSQSMIVWNLFVGHAIVHPTVMMRREVLDLRQPLYNPDYKYSQDFELWHFLLDKVIFANVDQELLTRRSHALSSTRKKPKEWRIKNYDPALESFEKFTNCQTTRETMHRLMYHNIEGQFFNEQDVENSIATAMTLFHSLADGKLIKDDEQYEVQHDLIRRIMLLSRQSPSIQSSVLRSHYHLAQLLIPNRIRGIWRRYVAKKA